MREQFLFDALEKERNKLLQLAESCPADKRNLVPAGFNNNVLWNLGHILTVTDTLVYSFTGNRPKLSGEYMASFGNGTKPAEWTNDVPAWDTVISFLKEQPGELRSTLTGKFAEKVIPNFFKAETVEELLQSALHHETEHVGVVNAMVKTLKAL